MLHIVLTILKILGIIILAVLTLMLVLILCVLFVPIRYSARVEYHGTLTVNARVSFLLRIISFHFQKNKDTEMKLRIFGIPIPMPGKSKDKGRRKRRRRKMEQMDKETEMFEHLSEEIHQESHMTDSEAEEKYISLQKLEEKKDELAGQKMDSEQTEPETGAGQKSSHMESRIEEPEDSKQKTDKDRESDSIFTRIKHFISSKLLKIKYIFRRFCDTIKDIYGKIKWFIVFLKDKQVWQAFRDVKAEAIKLLKHIKPRKIKGYLHFGFDSPCTTGKLYGFICMFYTKLPKRFLLQADFENKVLDGDLLIKGRIQIYYLLIIALRLYRNDNLKQVMKKRRTYGGE